MSQRWVLDWSFSLITMSYDGAMAEIEDTDSADSEPSLQEERHELLKPEEAPGPSILSDPHNCVRD